MTDTKQTTIPCVEVALAAFVEYAKIHSYVMPDLYDWNAAIQAIREVVYAKIIPSVEGKEAETTWLLIRNYACGFNVTKLCKDANSTYTTLGITGCISSIRSAWVMCVEAILKSV